MLSELLAKLAPQERNAQGIDNFANHLFGDVDRDALPAYSAEKLAEITSSAFNYIADKQPGTHLVRAYNVASPFADDSRSNELTIIEVCKDDMPFIVDSLMGEIHARDIRTHIVLHPILNVVRDGSGSLQRILSDGEEQAGGAQESFVQIHIDQVSGQQRDDLVAELDSILGDVRVVISDWRSMLERTKAAIASYHQIPQSAPVAGVAESIAFLDWLVDGSFIFLGVREFQLVGDAQTGDLEPNLETGLGILRNPDVRVLRRGRELVHMTPEVRRFFFRPEPLIVTKSNVIARVHRRSHMDYIGLKIYSQSGALTGELRVVGLFTSTAYTQSVQEIPLLREKATGIVEHFGHPPDSHDGKALINVIETFPRDELFQIDTKTLAEWAANIRDLELMPQTRVFARVDEFDRFVSVLVFVPRDRYTTDVRQRIGDYLATVFNGRVSAFFPNFNQGAQVRVQYIIGRYDGETPYVAQSELEVNVREIVTTWSDRLQGAIAAQNDNVSASDLVARYASAFSVGYSDNFTTRRALVDIGRVDQLDDENPNGLNFYQRDGDAPHVVNVTLYRLDEPTPLSVRVPILENFGFSVIDERSYHVRPTIGGRERDVRLQSMVLHTVDQQPGNLENCAKRLEDCYLAIWDGRCDNDHFNRLIRTVGVDWREAAVLRTYTAYLRQIQVPYGPRYMSDTLLNHVGVTQLLFEMFRVRFDPDLDLSIADRDGKAADLRSKIEIALAEIPSLDEDRILRHFTNLIMSTLRTNFYQAGRRGTGVETFAMKLDSPKVENSPEPRPHKEIFVYSPRVEGIHLRGGPIARGGLRWSDRAQDYRTEVLGLAKAQQVKNVVIVPAGAKGGFLPKQLPRDGGREAFLSEGVASYRIFVSNLINITDNLIDGKTVPPARVVRHDGDDPYLVVAADKGTATFSDFANEISHSKQFWLGDAFASGGSAGYDHKKMAITARGGWESVKRLFREMDLDIQTTPFEVIGVGDMSGDVFGNGMLLSKFICLKAAFDHRDIFFDPAPDPAVSWGERKRVFDLPRSSWADYDKTLISAGGGVFSRASKSIPLSDEMRAMTGLTGDSAAPNDIIRAILKIKSDLLWFGGIGTYVKAAHEADEAVGDRANDTIRITADELAVKVIGEGANLGMTQPARIAFAMRGGRINTDAIDNSAGVNSSDLEVNIKIAVRPSVDRGDFNQEQRNEFLASMTNDVAESCLRNNYLQTLALSIGEQRGMADFGFQQRLMRDFEHKGLLDREIEQLPSDAVIAERLQSGTPLTRPELSVLLAYAKIDLFNQLVESAVPDDPYFEAALMTYFPPAMRERMAGDIREHRLRREIIATVLTNSVINRGGSTMAVRLAEETGRPVKDIVYSYAAIEDVFGLTAIWSMIDSLDNKISGAEQLKLYRTVQGAVRRGTAWFLRHGDFSKGLEDLGQQYRDGLARFKSVLEGALPNDQRVAMHQRRQEFVDNGVPEELAAEITALEYLAVGLDAVSVSLAADMSTDEVAGPFFEVANYFRFGELRHTAEQIEVTDYYERLAINSTLSTIADAHRSITANVLRPSNNGQSSFEVWLEAGGPAADRAKASLDEILDGGMVSLAHLTVAASQVRDLVPN